MGKIMTELEEQLVSGTYFVTKDGEYQQLAAGAYIVDDAGQVNQVVPPAINWQSAIDNIKWDEAHKLVENWGKRGAKERTLNVFGMYVLVAIVILAASYLALVGIVEGQALVGFLGAAIGYILSRGNLGLK